MSLIDDPRLMPLEREDRVFLGGLFAVLGILLLASVLWYHCDDRPLTQLESARDQKVPDVQIDVNHAGWAELALLPRVGEVLARRIVDFRDTKGPFMSVDELDNVKGIGPKVLDGIRPLLKSLPSSADTGERAAIGDALGAAL